MSRWLPAALALLSPALALAQQQADVPPPEIGLRDMLHARSYAMGGAFRALGQGAEAADGNPASMTLIRHYLIELSGAWDAQTKYAFGTASILDSTSPVAAGVTYHLASIGRGDHQTIAHVSTLALGYALTENIHVGVSMKHVLMTGFREGNAITTDAGIELQMLQGFVASFSGHNLIDIQNPLITRYYALSFGYLAGTWTLATDIRGDFGIAPTPQFAYSFGGEYVLANQFPVRAGYSFDSITHSHFVSGGLGYVTETGGGIDIAYRHEIGGNQGRLICLTLKMQVQ